jgi:hypothetical protein
MPINITGSFLIRWAGTHIIFRETKKALHKNWYCLPGVVVKIMTVCTRNRSAQVRLQT